MTDPTPMSRVSDPRRSDRSALRSQALVVGLSGALAAGVPADARASGNLVLLEAPPAATTCAIGLSAWSLPTYPGAAAHKQSLLPGLDCYAADGWFVSTDTGLGWNLSSRADLQAGLRLWPQLGRPASATPPGLSPVGNRLQLETFANYAPLPVLLLQGGWLYGAGRNRDGTQLELGATSGMPIGGDLIGVTLAATWANAAYRQSYFGISPEEAAASALPRTTVNGGWHDASILFSAEHRLDARWQLSGQLLIARLLGAAARSPVTASATQTSGTVTLWREF